MLQVCHGKASAEMAVSGKPILTGQFGKGILVEVTHWTDTYQ